MDPHSRVVLLEAQVETLSDELMQCQADKEFVWSLWKRLQVAHPDLTQAVSLVVEREKQKAEMKDRKVLEILQTKDYKIQELEQRATEQQREVNVLQQKNMLTAEERAAFHQEISSLQEKLAGRAQEVQDVRTQHAGLEEEVQGAMRALEEQKEEWTSRCSGLQADLEEERRRGAARHQEQREAAQTRLEGLEAQVSSLQSTNHSLAALLSARDKDTEAQEGPLSRLRGELAEVQARYGQSRQHAAEQAHLIQQLEGLNLDTQRVLRHQEEAHAADTASSQRTYTDLSQSYQALVDSEAQLRQTHLELRGLLAHRDQNILDLQSQLQEQQVLLSKQQTTSTTSSTGQQTTTTGQQTTSSTGQQTTTTTGQQTTTIRGQQTTSSTGQQTTTTGQQTTTTGQQTTSSTGQQITTTTGQQTTTTTGQQTTTTGQQTTTTGQQPTSSSTGQQPTKQTNVKELCELSPDGPVWTPRPGSHQASSCSGPEPGTSQPLDGGPWSRRTSRPSSSRGLSTSRGHQDAPVQRSRSLSPVSGVESRGGVRRGGGAEHRLQDLEELLQLKTQELDVLRRAHHNRLQRLQLIQANYRTLRAQLKVAEEGHGLPAGRGQRAEPWQLRQEDSDGVWNELAYYRRLARKLSVDKANLEEEMDVLRVQAAVDRTTVKEQHLCLLNEHQELAERGGAAAAERRVRRSAQRQQRAQHSALQMEQLERRILSLEEETEALGLEKERLLESREQLSSEGRLLRASVELLHRQAAARQGAARAQALAQRERHRGETQALEARLAAAEKEVASLRRRALKLRQELGLLRAARDFHRRSAAGGGGGGGGGAVGPQNTKVKLRTARPAGPARRGRRRAVGPNQAISWHGRQPGPAKDEWEDVSTDSEEAIPDSLDASDTRILSAARPTTAYRSAVEGREDGAGRRTSGPSPGGRRWRAHGERAESSGEPSERKRSSVSACSLRHSVESLQRRARLGAVREARRANHDMAARLHACTQELGDSKQLTQKLTCDLAGVELQKRVLEMELEQWRKIQLPPPPPPPPAPAPAAGAGAGAGAAGSCSCQGEGLSAPNNLRLQALEAEVKQLQAKLKGGAAEASRQAAAIKASRALLLDTEEKLRTLQDRAGHAERDVVMKRRLVEDLRTRLTVLQDGERCHRGRVEELENQVKSQSEESTNRKAFIESMKRRLAVATSEKKLQETSCTKLREDLEKKERLLQTLQAQVGAGQRSLAQLEQTATGQMEVLTQQSTQALDLLQRRLGLASSQVEQLHTFVKALAHEMLRDVQEVKQQLTETRSSRRRSRRRCEEASAAAARGAPAARSMIRAKSIAASILHMSEHDLADMLDGDQVQAPEPPVEIPEQDWLQQLQHILQQKIPSAGQLMEAVRVKMKERKVLTEELAALATPVSENA